MKTLALVIGFSVFGVNGVLADTVRDESQAVRQDIAVSRIELKSDWAIRQSERTPVSVVRLKRLPDGSLEQHCDVVMEKHSALDHGQPRGQWVQTPEERLQ